MFVAFMPVAPRVSMCKICVFYTFRRWISISRNFFCFFLKFNSYLLHLNLYVSSSQQHFYGLQNTLFGFILFQSVSRNFPPIFGGLGVFFMAYIWILDFSRIILSMKLINSENNKSLIFPNAQSPCTIILKILKAHTFIY